MSASDSEFIPGSSSSSSSSLSAASDNDLPITQSEPELSGQVSEGDEDDVLWILSNAMKSANDAVSAGLSREELKDLALAATDLFLKEYKRVKAEQAELSEEGEAQDA